MAHIIRVIDDSVIQQVSNLYVIIRIHYAGHKSAKLGFRDRLDLDHILTEGDSLLKTVNTSDMLSVNDLPRFVRVYDENVQIKLL